MTSVLTLTALLGAGLGLSGCDRNPGAGLDAAPAPAALSSAVATGSRPRSSVIFRHMQGGYRCRDVAGPPRQTSGGSFDHR